MERTYVIAWKSKIRPSAGQGKRLLTWEEANELALQLNHDHPNFVHEPVNLNSDDSVPQSNAVNALSQVIIHNTQFGSVATDASDVTAPSDLAAFCLTGCFSKPQSMGSAPAFEALLNAGG